MTAKPYTSNLYILTPTSISLNLYSQKKTDPRLVRGEGEGSVAKRRAARKAYLAGTGREARTTMTRYEAC